MPTLDGDRRRVGVLPAGVVVCADAVDCLNRAIDALGRGLPVLGWHWTRRALEVLDVATGGEVTGKRLENGG